MPSTFMPMLSSSLGTSTLVNTGYPRIAFPWHYNPISNHSFKPLPSLHHHGPSTKASFGTSPQHCRNTHNGPSMKSSLLEPHKAPLKLAPGSQPTLTHT